ncbi:hypothetical protein DCS_05653 [Drechmeria coniospora]|uniref:Extracellular serine-rich protein n=1 Tax=Drechmeria coniospora TaxID=98403 RepID=A0A151GNG3_DRECN|nr:hypothetical protein DCS_05653 [Drechmeria coniospora]KYK58636.1 hypothetical protein DCS_05653 [Drechmeria coniospora]ODA84001.1 hypothetical protein RJ55_02519 [Drechmeria coniospora]
MLHSLLALPSRRTTPWAVILPLLSSGALAKTVLVEVGSAGFTYSPNSVQADVGDVVQFHFNGAHSVTSGPFNGPCTPDSSGGFYSGFLTANASTTIDPIPPPSSSASRPTASKGRALTWR